MALAFRYTAKSDTVLSLVNQWTWGSFHDSQNLPALTAFALVGAAAAVASAPATAAQYSAGHVEITPTPFALSASGYASRVVGGGVPAGSDRSAFQVIGCTNRAGLHKSNAEAEVDLGELQLSGLRTDVWTTKENNTVSSWGRNRIAKVVLADNPAGRLILEGVRSTSRTWHNSTGFHASTDTDVASIVFDPAGSVLPNVNFPAPTPGNPVTVEGVAVIAVGDAKRSAGAESAQAMADALRIRIIPTGTVAYLAHSRAQISSGLAQGIYSGSAYATRANVIDGLVTSGPTPLVVMPCTGTKLVEKSIAHANLGVGGARGLNASQFGGSRNGNPTAFERGEVARANLLGGRLVVKGVVGKANVTLVGDTARKNVDGTKLASVFFNGREIDLTGRDSLRLGDVARLQPSLVKRTKYGIEVTALRVTLFRDDVELNLGHAKVAIRPSGL